MQHAAIIAGFSNMLEKKSAIIRNLTSDRKGSGGYGSG